MNGESKPFQRLCRWCGDPFTAKRESDNHCCLECSEELHQHLEELTLVKWEFNSLQEEVEVLHEELGRIYLRGDKQVRKLQRLGAQWQRLTSEEDRAKIEKRERLTARALERLNIQWERRSKNAVPHEMRLAELERAVRDLKKMVGDDSPVGD